MSNQKGVLGHNENHELSSLGGWLQNLVIDNEDDTWGFSNCLEGWGAC